VQGFLPYYFIDPWPTGQWEPADHGEWTVKIEGMVGPTQGTATGHFVLAEDCEALQAEFVPEPGTIALLGSGLAGLAGYAALRWRSRS
jgi:hypothetical protein